jgi:DNA-binding MarR family transcriptional regulator
VTAFEKRLARSSARDRDTPRLRLIRRYARPGAHAPWTGSEAARRRAGGPVTLLREATPSPDASSRDGLARDDDPGRRAVSLWLRLLAAHNLILREVRRGMGGAATLPQFDVLAQLQRQSEGLLPSELTRALLVTAGNVTGIVRRLEKQGLVERLRVPGDRRAVRVRLTDRGRARMAELLPIHAQALESILGRVPTADLAGLRERLLDLVRRLEEPR